MSMNIDDGYNEASTPPNRWGGPPVGTSTGLNLVTRSFPPPNIFILFQELRALYLQPSI
jgi:hypothetical protein